MYDNHKIYIDAKSGSENGTIHDNYLNTTAIPIVPAYGTTGIYVDAYDDSCGNISIYNNVIWGSGTALELGTEQGGILTNIALYNNICNGTGNGFQINNHTQNNPGGNNHAKRNIKVINNVFTGNNICMQITDVNSSFYNFTIRNNIFEGTIGINIGTDLDLSYHNVDHNLYNYDSYTSFLGDDYIIADPLLIDPANGDYSFSSNSPAIDNGSSVGAPDIDFEGTSRSKGSQFDIGAFEFNSADADLPQISDISITTSNPLDTSVDFGWENVSCTIIDNSEITEINITISFPDNSQSCYSMNKISNENNYYYNFSWNEYGTYTYWVNVEDSYQNINVSNNFTFALPPNWDVNEDGKCNVLDLTLVSHAFKSNGYNGWIREDVDNNGEIKVLDLVLVANHYDKH